MLIYFVFKNTQKHKCTMTYTHMGSCHSQPLKALCITYLIGRRSSANLRSHLWNITHESRGRERPPSGWATPDGGSHLLHLWIHGLPASDTHTHTHKHTHTQTNISLCASNCSLLAGGTGNFKSRENIFGGKKQRRSSVWLSALLFHQLSPEESKVTLADWILKHNGLDSCQ